MNSVRGIIFAYHNYVELGELGKYRTAAALPVAGRYRLVDFALSAMMNAEIYNVDMLMQFGFQSLIDHARGGRPWNMIRHFGGLHLMLAKVNQGVYGGDMEALDAVIDHLKRDVKEDYIVLTRADLLANLDLKALVEEHVASGATVTALCTDQKLPGEHHSFVLDGNGFAKDLLCRRMDSEEGVRSLETYVMSRESLLHMVEWCAEGDRLHFHRDAMLHMMRNEGWRVKIRMHDGYAHPITNVKEYYEANTDLLAEKNFVSLFMVDRQIATPARSDVSTYYSDSAEATDSLVADGCIIEGKLDHCVVFSGVKIEAGASLKNCIVLNGATVKAGAVLENTILDKDVVVESGAKYVCSPSLPQVVPKGFVLKP